MKESLTEISPWKRLLHEEIRENDPMKASKIVEKIIYIRSDKNISLIDESRRSERPRFEEPNRHKSQSGSKE
jgi:hypothetical protein